MKKNKLNIFLLVFIAIFNFKECFSMKNKLIEENLDNLLVQEIRKLQDNNLDLILYNINQIINLGYRVKNSYIILDAAYKIIIDYKQDVPDKIKEIFRIIINLFGLNINEKIRYFDSLIILASRENNYELLKIILENPRVNINYKNSDGFTALTTTIMDGKGGLSHNQVVKLLLEHLQIDLSIKTIVLPQYFKSYDALGLAKKLKEQFNDVLIERNLDSHYDLILKRLKKWREDLFKSIGDNKENSDLGIFKLCLIKLGAYVQDDQGNNILHQAIIKNNKGYVEKILCLAPDLLLRKNKAGLTPFDLAIKNMHKSDLNNNSMITTILDLAYGINIKLKENLKKEEK